MGDRFPLADDILEIRQLMWVLHIPEFPNKAKRSGLGGLGLARRFDLSNAVPINQ